jgi:hypothetical protein
MESMTMEPEALTDESPTPAQTLERLLRAHRMISHAGALVEQAGAEDEAVVERVAGLFKRLDADLLELIATANMRIDLGRDLDLLD